MQQIKNIIFDLGGVLLDIDYQKTANAFRELGFDNFDQLYTQFTANDLFEKLETGTISEADFFATLSQYSRLPVKQEQMEAAWNAMLMQFRKDSLAFLGSLKGKYQLFLLSNTNSIHHRAFNAAFTRETGHHSLDDFFTTAYYSHVLKKRKPYKETYEFVLQEGNMIAGETLFIDDSFNNIEGAQLAGIQTHLLKTGQLIEELPI